MPDTKDVPAAVPSRASSRVDSTSWHELSADDRLSKVQRILWIFYNLANNAFPRVAMDARIKELTFRLTENELDVLWRDIPESASPPRALCDLFWMTLPWAELLKPMGRVRALEIGCGSGIYGRLLEKLLGESFERYVGVDIQANEQWRRGPSGAGRFSFEIGRASDAYKFLPGSNLILTQSALEHFEEDLLYFRQVSAYVVQSKFPILQVHLIPAASCLTTFPWHGIREYTPRTISRITRLFGAETSFYLFGLGDSACNRVHRSFITWPNLLRGADLRHTNTLKYRDQLRSAILNDFRSTPSHAAFYALVLATNFRSVPAWKT